MEPTVPGSDDETGLADVKAAAFDDLVALGDDLRALDLDISMPGVAPEAVADYTAAIDGYQEASLRFDRVATTAALRTVSEALEEGRFRLACAQARLAGRPLPTRRGPCFFDPRHGPATADVLWAPPGGVARSIAVCAPDADILAGGGEPEVREIQVAGASVPYWQAPAAFDAWAGGFYTPPQGGRWSAAARSAWRRPRRSPPTSWPRTRSWSWSRSRGRRLTPGRSSPSSSASA
jgi:hypothetical protein